MMKFVFALLGFTICTWGWAAQQVNSFGLPRETELKDAAAARLESPAVELPDANRFASHVKPGGSRDPKTGNSLVPKSAKTRGGGNEYATILVTISIPGAITIRITLTQAVVACVAVAVAILAAKMF
jgi:hypothetical protein